ATITIDATQPGLLINGDLWGSNLLQYAPASMTVNHTGFVDASRQIGVSVVRWPGGNNADVYDWKRDEQIKPGRRIHDPRLVNIVRMIQFARDIGAEPSITVNFGAMNAQDAADLVEFLNGPADSPWGAQRAAQGFPEPLNVRFFEIGNEEKQPHMWYFSWTAENPEKYFFGGEEERRGFYGGSEHDPVGAKGDFFRADGGPAQEYVLRFPPVRDVRVFWAATREDAENHVFEEWLEVADLSTQPADARVFTLEPEAGILHFGDGVHGAMPPAGSYFLVEYTTYDHDGFLDFAHAMRAAPSSVPIQIGAAMLPFVDGEPITDTVHMQEIFAEMDFYVRHQYDAAFPPRAHGVYQNDRQIAADRVDILTTVYQRVQQYLAGIGLTDSPGIGVTEWNVYLNDEYWHINRTLEGGVIAAEWFIRLLNAGQSVPLVYANQFALHGGNLALIRSQTNGSIAPMGYVFEGFSSWPGSRVVSTTVTSPEAVAYDVSVPYVAATAALSPDPSSGSGRGGQTLRIAVVNNAEMTELTTALEITGFTPASARLWRLSADSYDADNDGDPTNVVLEEEPAQVPLTTLTLPPHSVTFVELDAPSQEACVGDVNANGIGDVVDIQTTAADLTCHVYLPLVAAQWRQPWPESPFPWVWLEGEEFAETNFPRGSHSTRGQFCAECSGDEYLLFLPGHKGRPFDPPGYWYADYALRVPAPGDYRHVWIALWPADAPFSWSVDDQSPIPATILEWGPAYGADPAFRWVRLDPTGLDLRLNPQDNPHTLHLRRNDPDSPRMQIDAIVLTTDPAWAPSGIEKPPVDRSYLDAYPDYVLYTRSWMEHILPDTIPEPGEITTTLSAFATPGEYEPLTFAIYARQPLSDVIVSVTELTPVGIPATEIDLRVVRVVTKRRDSKSSPDETELVPEILDYNTPQDIPAETSKQYWLIIHVPPDAVAGTYQGTITVSPANAPARALNLTLEVLPIVLQTPPDRAFSIGYTPLREFDGVPLPGDPFTYLEQDHRDIREHGMNSGAVYTPVNVTLGPGDAVQVDYSDLIRHMDLLGDMGFTGPAHWRGIYQLPRDLQSLGVVTPTLEAVYTEVVSTVLSLRDERGWSEIYFFPVDEPFGNPQKEAELYWLGPLIKQVPGALIEVSLDGAEVLPDEADPITDVRFYNGWSVDFWMPLHPFEEIAADAAASGDRLAFYYNTRGLGGRPEFSRATWGIYAWNSPFAEQGVWTYHHFVGDPYDDSDGHAGDLAYAYPDPARDYAPTLPTLRWEGVREGLDDLRYIYTLEQTMQAAQGDPSKSDALARAEALLEQLRADLNRYGPEARGIMAYFEPDDYARYRREIAQAITDLHSGYALVEIEDFLENAARLDWSPQIAPISDEPQNVGKLYALTDEGDRKEILCLAKRDAHRGPSWPSAWWLVSSGWPASWLRPSRPSPGPTVPGCHRQAAS
ncbi:MAG: hypothetical protein ACE5HA_11375, partial [Anaerolineae bacterium]